MSFVNKVFVVTGANSGMGYDVARYLTSEGAKVYITGRTAEAVAEAATTLGINAIGVVANTASITDSIKLAEMIAANGDKLDGLFVNAGIAKKVPFADVGEAHFDETFNINAKGAFFTIQKLLPVLRDGASIVLNGSGNVHMGNKASTVYAASKAALNSFAKTMSRDLLPRRIRVNVMNPGPIQTPLFDKTGMSADAMRGVMQMIGEGVPVGRMGQVEEITGYVAFLLSDKSTFILGTELTIDGGMTQL